MRKSLKFILMSLIVLLSFSLLIKAAEVNFTDAEVIKEASLKNMRFLDGGITLYQYHTYAYNDGYIEENRLNDYVVSWLDYGENKNVRIVNWTSSGLDGYGGSTVTALAKNYEKTHPGYLVIAGINGDFFDIEGDHETLNMSMQEGLLYKPYSYPGYSIGVIGWEKDGTIHAGKPTMDEKMSIEKKANGDFSTIGQIDKVNDGISSTGYSLLTNDAFSQVDLSGCTVFEISYSTHRFSNMYHDLIDRLYIQGEISAVHTDLGVINEIPEYHVYLVCKNNSLSLALGDEIRLQYHLNGDWANVLNITGYYSRILEDGQSLCYQSATHDVSDVEEDISYVNCKKNRTIIGQRADGSTVLMTVEYNKKGNYGASYYECGEYLRSVGCVKGWLLDGGGSTTMIVRNASGDYDLVAGASDGSERADGNGILLVVKDPGVGLKVEDTTRSSITLSVLENNSPFLSDVSNLRISVNGVVKEYNESPLTFDGLEEETTYEATLLYDLNSGGTTFSGKRYLNVKTASFAYPDVTLRLVETSNTEALFSLKFTSSSAVASITNVKLLVEGHDTEYPANLSRGLVKDLSPNTYYNVYVSFDAVEKGTSKIYHATSSSLKFKTAAKAKPLLVDLNLVSADASKAVFSYVLSDPEGVATRGYFDYYGITEDIDLTANTFSVEDVDFTAGETEISLVIEYDGGSTTPLSAVVPKQEAKQEVTPAPAPSSKRKCGKKNSSIMVMMFIACTCLVYIFKKRK